MHMIATTLRLYTTQSSSYNSEMQYIQYISAVIIIILGHMLFAPRCKYTLLNINITKSHCTITECFYRIYLIYVEC